MTDRSRTAIAVTLHQSVHPRNDNTAVRMGFTVHKLIDIGGSQFAALCHPETDFDGRFKCFDTDSQEWIIVNGWLMDSCEDAD